MQMADDGGKDLYPYPGKTKSRVWEFFRFLKNREGPPTKHNLDMSKAICVICNKAYANNGKF